LSDLAVSALKETHRGRNCTHLMAGQLQQSLYGRVASYEDVNDAEGSVANFSDYQINSVCWTHYIQRAPQTA